MKMKKLLEELMNLYESEELDVDKVEELIKKKGLSYQRIYPFSGGAGWGVTIDSRDYVLDGVYGVGGWEQLFLVPRKIWTHETPKDRYSGIVLKEREK